MSTTTDGRDLEYGTCDDSDDRPDCACSGAFADSCHHTPTHCCEIQLCNTLRAELAELEVLRQTVVRAGLVSGRGRNTVDVMKRSLLAIAAAVLTAALTLALLLSLAWFEWWDGPMPVNDPTYAPKTGHTRSGPATAIALEICGMPGHPDKLGHHLISNVGVQPEYAAFAEIYEYLCAPQTN